MRDDLLDARTAVGWAVAQTVAFDERVKSWASINLNVRIEDTPAPATHNRVIALLKEPLPRVFNVEFGAYVNVIRTALDMLAVTLAERYRLVEQGRISNLSEVYFPIAKSAHAFASGNPKGRKFVNALPDVERLKIEALQPYQGGHKYLWNLHHLDIVRKHHRLIELSARPVGFGRANSTIEDFVPNPRLSDWTLSVNQETEIGTLRKGRDDDYVKFFPAVACAEAGETYRYPVAATLFWFADTATKIIALFDE
jgi:hypothetical protein